MASVSGSVENGSMVQVDEAKIRGHVDEVVRSSVEATFNGLLISCAVRSVTSGQQTASTRVPGATTVRTCPDSVI